jgi:hypothetical protein
MEYVLAFAIISHVYAFAYMVRDEKLNVYRLSVVLLLTLVGLCLGMLLFGTFSNLKFIDRLANEFFHGVLVQSFICMIVSARIAFKNDHWGYLSHSIVFFTVFLIIVFLKVLAA